ncbi:hypothetical protein VIGAN_03139500 [Vigna angularis var. angularis]|uniref:Uncharacterized protein n=1 Tax=Vigna angularis var. angularis TaxID=157739 RepID=A0A0S3RM17_PHAAN|nr:hypothetical protein VIGAN_03139500 [Vigna angularis var. angularis]
MTLLLDVAAAAPCVLVQLLSVNQSQNEAPLLLGGGCTPQRLISTHKPNEITVCAHCNRMKNGIRLFSPTKMNQHPLSKSK